MMNLQKFATVKNNVLLQSAKGPMYLDITLWNYFL